MPLILGANSLTGGYEIDNSLRFNSGSSDYLSRTPASAGNRQIWTLSGWYKLAVTNTTDRTIFGAGTDGDNQTLINFQDTSVILFSYELSNVRYIVDTDAVYRDQSAWYHVVVAVDTTQATDTNRVKIYVNGVQQTLAVVLNGYPPQNANTFVNNTSAHSIGYASWVSSNFYNGYMSEVNLIDGQQLTPTSFGEFDEDSGIWKPIAYTGTYGTNGFYLEFKDSSALGDDTSGNSNDFTVNNLTSIDQTTDTPTNNFSTYNSLISLQSQTYSEGNLQVATTSTNKSGGFSTIGMSSGKWYAEFKVTDSNNRTTIGISGNPAELDRSNQYVGFGLYDYSYVAELGNKANNNSETAYGNSYTQNDIIGVALDLDNNYIYFSKNGTWQNSGDPESGASGTGSAFNVSASSSTPTGFYFFGAGDVASNQTGTIQSNFGNPPFTISSGNSDGNGIGLFEYPVPAGFFSLCTNNLSTEG